MDIATEQLSPAEEAALEGRDDAAPLPEQIETEQPAPQPQPQQRQPQAQPQQPPKTVPLRSLTDARDEIKSLKESLRERDAKLDLVLNRFDRFMQVNGAPAQPAAQPQPKPEPEEEIPAKETDPLGYLDGRISKVTKLVESLVTENKNGRELTQQQQQVVRNAASLQGLETEYMATNPHYQAASAFLQQARDRMLQAGGIRNAQERKNIMAREGYELGLQAIQEGINPAARVYELAQALGWAPPQEETPPGEGEPEVDENSNEIAPEPQPQPQPRAQPRQQPGVQPRPVATPAQRVANAMRGQQQARSLGTARGGRKPPLTAQSLIDMDEATFDAAMQTAEGRALMGE